jgi:hypothetical protein
MILTDWLIFAIGNIDQARIHFLAFQITHGNNSIESTIYNILNALILGMFLNALGFVFSIQDKKTKFILLFIIIFILLLGIQNIGFRISIHIPLFENWYSFSSNTVDGIYFFSLNIGIWTILWGSSFLIESDYIE